jgi:sulfatase modifying factor 1
MSQGCCVPQRPNSSPAATTPLPTERVGASNTEDFVPIASGQFEIGSNLGEGLPADGEGPARQIALSGFHIAATAVTNAQFRRFVQAVDYVTDAERFGASFVFHKLVPAHLLRQVGRHVAATPWWLEVRGACWRRPFGPGSIIQGRLDHPVVHISWNDACAYCKWAGVRLPSETEWEVAARGGLTVKRYPWGDTLMPEGKHRCNIYQGRFPEHDTGEDGFVGTCPVRSFPCNGYGLYEMVGNVWEWCQDFFSRDFHQSSAAHDPRGPACGEKRVLRGGSFLCHDSYCNRYRNSARNSATADTSSSHIGFRCARNEPARLATEKARVET